MSDPLQDPATPPPELLPISTAPRDGTFIIAYTKPALEDKWMGMANRPFAIKHMGRTTASGLDLGWSLFPGMGVSDNWFEGWMPITRPPRPERDPGNDIRILLAQIDWLQECLGETLESEDAALVAQIRADWSPQPEGDTGPSVVCNGCGWEGDEDGLIATLDAEDGEPCRACPDCRTDANLMDVPAQPSAATQPAQEAVPVAWRYRYVDPVSGKPIWRYSNNLWNGQRPSESQPLYAHPPRTSETVAEALREIRAAVQDGNLSQGVRLDIIDKIALRALKGGTEQ